MTAPEQMVVLVSSSQQEARFWDALLPGLKDFPKVSEAYQFHHLPIYSMLPAQSDGSFLRRFLQRYQWQADTLARALQKAPFWDERPDCDPVLTLMGFGPGCRLIQEFLLGCLIKDDTVRQLRRIHQVVFLSPRRSHWVAGAFGGIFALALLSILLYLLWPSQVLLVGIASAILALFTVATSVLAIATSPLALRVLGMESEWFLGARMHKEFDERIKRGSRRLLGTWPVSSQEYWPFRVKRAEPKVIQEIAEAILEPTGHPNVYELDLLEYSLAVAPVAPKDLPQEVRDSLVIKEEYTSQATYRSHVHFAGNDQTANEEARKNYGDIVPWELRQRTRGYLEVHDPASSNLATSEENFAKHSGYIYRFRPKPNEDHFLHVVVYGGYDTNNRDSHMHLRADANFRLIRGTLDLSGYLSQRWHIKEPEVLYFPSRIPSMRLADQAGSLERNLRDLECDCMTNKRVLGQALEVKQIAPGVFRWEMPDVRNGGIIAYEYDVYPPIG